MTLSREGYVVSGRNDGYSLTWSLADGRIVRLDRTFEAVPLAGPERAEWQAHLEEWNRRWPVESPPLPSHKPILRSLSVDENGRIWARRYAAAKRYPDRVSSGTAFGWPNQTWLEPVVHDVLEPRGRYLGSVTLPPGAELHFAKGERLWVVEKGEFDEDYIVLYLVPALRKEG